MSETTSPIPGTPVDLDLEPGQVVGEYTVEGKLGQGGFGAVFKAVHPLIGKEVAIKVLARRYSVDPEMVERFVREARAVNQIRNRHIIDIFSFGQVPDGRQYYVMEYLDGEALDAAIEREGRMSLVAALPILRAIARALDAAHTKGIAHRDLKPENVFLVRDADGTLFPKLLDFGIAKLMSPDDVMKSKTRTGAPVGTPYYMSPEQCRGKDVDHRTDFYAFGVVAYRMLTGAYPFDGDDYMDILIKQIGEEPSAPSTLNPELPPGIDDAIAWLMKKDPAERPPNLITAVKALEAAAEEAGIAVSTRWDLASSPDIARFATPPIGGLARAVTPAPTVQPMAPTVDAGVPVAEAAKPRGKAMIAILGSAVVAVAAVAAFVTFGGGGGGAGSGGQGSSAASAPAVAPAPPPVPVEKAPPPAPMDKAPPVAEAVAAVDAPAPAPAPITLSITGAPAETEVLAAGAVIGHAPGSIELPPGTDPVVLTFRHDGFASLTQTIVPDHDRALTVKLHHAATATQKQKAATDSHDIEDPFHH